MRLHNLSTYSKECGYLFTDSVSLVFLDIIDTQRDCLEPLNNIFDLI